MTLDELSPQIDAAVTAGQAAVAKLTALKSQVTDLSAQLQAAAGDPAKVQAVADKLTALAKSLTDAAA